MYIFTFVHFSRFSRGATCIALSQLIHTLGADLQVPDAPPSKDNSTNGSS